MYGKVTDFNFTKLCQSTSICIRIDEIAILPICKKKSYRFVPNVFDSAGQQGSLAPEHGDVTTALQVIEVGLCEVGFPDSTGSGFPEM